MEKLIRTKLKEKILEEYPDSQFKVLSNKELKKALKVKLQEETLEFLESTQTVNEIEELGDILEVIDALFTLEYFEKKDVYQIKSKKLKDRGGFLEGVFWER